MNNNQNFQHVITNKVRLSYVHLFTPFATQIGAEPKYSVTILVPKSDYATKQKIDAALAAAIQQGISEKFNGVRPPVMAIPVHDGDGPRPSDGMPFGPECKGHWVLTASSKQRPEVVDANLNPILNQTEVYSGMYARVSMRFFPFSANGKKGIGCGLGNVQKLEDGEPLGGRTSAASDFGGQAPAPGYTQPAYTPAAPAAYNPYTPPVQTYPGAYPQPIPAPVYPQQPPAPYAPQPVQIDPITGLPVNGGVMGI